MYDETNISCIPLPTSISYIFSWKWIDENNSTMEANGIIYNLTNTFESGCSKGITPTKYDIDLYDLYVRDALYDYDVMVQLFQQLYPYFEVKNIDWNKSSQEARLLLRSNSSDTELWDTMEKVLMPLDDSFVTMRNDGGSYFETNTDMALDMLEKEAKDIGESDVYLYAEQERLKFVDKISTYMEDSELFNVTNATRCLGCDDMNAWSYGQIKGTTIGYMSLFDFSTLYNFNVSIIDNDFVVSATINFEVFDHLFQTAFQNMSSMIIDVRTNLGGDDSMALLLASYFSSERQLAWVTRTRQYQVDDGLMDADSYYLNSSSFHFTGPVVVMMSESTVGSGESFILAMSLLSQVTFLGKETQGALGAYPSDKMLPNGWYVSVPDEAIVSPNGTMYKGPGLLPDIVPDTDFFTLDERRSSTDAWLEMAIKYLNNTNTSISNTTNPEASSSSSEGTSAFDGYFHWMKLVIVMIVTFTYLNFEQ